jgi:hypothetical protein
MNSLSPHVKTKVKVLRLDDSGSSGKEKESEGQVVLEARYTLGIAVLIFPRLRSRGNPLTRSGQSGGTFTLCSFQH